VRVSVLRAPEAGKILTMTGIGWLQILLYFLAALLLTKLNRISNTTCRQCSWNEYR
jgi:hypothetical protein